MDHYGEAMVAVSEIDLCRTDLYQQGFPHDLFTELRATSPVFKHPPAEFARTEEPVEFWVLCDHASVQSANRDWETFSAIDGSGVYKTLLEHRNHMIVSMDPPQHSRMRRLISAGFTPRVIAQLDEHIRNRTEQILDEVAEQGECEFVSEVAYQLPMHIIADIMGIPEDDRPWVFERTDVMIKAWDPASGLGPEDNDKAQFDLWCYARDLGKAKRAEPADDVWTILAHAEIDGSDGDSTSLSEMELDMFFVILGLAGSETTRNALSMGLLGLMDHPDQMELLAERSDEVMGTAVEELIRWSSPVLLFGRTATRDVEVAGQLIKQGDRVTLWYPSANRDEAAFDDPFRFDLRRDPNPHVSFGGGGPHYCLGANLAKREVSVMIEQLLARFSDFRLTGEVEWLAAGPTTNVGVGVKRIPLAFSPN